MQYYKYVRNSKHVWKFRETLKSFPRFLNKHVVSYKLLKWIKYALVWRVCGKSTSTLVIKFTNAHDHNRNHEIV